MLLKQDPAGLKLSPSGDAFDVTALQSTLVPAGVRVRLHHPRLPARSARRCQINQQTDFVCVVPQGKAPAGPAASQERGGPPASSACSTSRRGTAPKATRASCSSCSQPAHCYEASQSRRAIARISRTLRYGKIWYRNGYSSCRRRLTVSGPGVDLPTTARVFVGLTMCTLASSALIGAASAINAAQRPPMVMPVPTT